MATKSYSQIQEQIEKLQAEAESVRRKEADGVIAQIKETIAVYGLRPTDLFDVKPRRAQQKSKTIRFADSRGNQWSGRGKRPEWIKAALKAGKTLDEFRV